MTSASSFVGILAAIALLYLGFFFWIYLHMRSRLKHMAKGKYRGRPVALFLMGVLGFFATSAIVFGVFALLYLPNALRMSIVIPIFCLGFGGSGVIGSIVLLIGYFGAKAERARFQKEHPLPKLQLWMQDLFAVAFCFGIYMAMLSRLGNWVSNDTPSAFPLAAFVLLAMGAGMYVALDLCRRSRRLQKPLPRLLLVSGLVFFSALSSLIPVWLSWQAWRYALYKAGWVLGDDAREKEVRGREAGAGLEAEA